MEQFELELDDRRLRDTTSKATVDLGHGSCSTEYVRGREAGEAGIPRIAVAVYCNESLNLQ